MSKIAIFTPVNKRGAFIKALFVKLQQQTNNNFSWYVMENGSLESGWLKNESISSKSAFRIKYYNLHTIGKPYAFNTFLSVIDEPWFLTVDSDDFLEHTFIETRLKLIDRHAHTTDIFCCPRYNKYGLPIGRPLPEDDLVLDNVLNQPNRGDFSCLISSSFCSSYRNIIFPGEYFISELNFYLWLTAHNARVKFLTLPGYISGGYLNDGVTANVVSTLRACPRSTAFTYVTASQSRYLSSINRTRYRINLWRFTNNIDFLPAHYRPWAIDPLLRLFFKILSILSRFKKL